MTLLDAKKPRTPPLRAAAEARLANAPPGKLATRPVAELLHELQVHQVELEMQNEALRSGQLALEESRDRYLDLYEFAPVGYLTLTAEGLISEVNLTASTLFGRDRARLLQQRFAAFVMPDDQDRWIRHFKKLKRGDGQGDAGLSAATRRLALALQRGDGTLFHTQLDCSHETSGAHRLRIALTDVSERKRAEEELRIAAIAFESQEGMMVTDAATVIIRVNHAFSTLTGYSAAESIGQTPKMLYSGRHGASFYKEMWRALAEKTYWQGEIWNKRKDGKIYAEWLTISAVSTPEGQISHYVGAFSDITQNKDASAQIHRLAYYDPLTGLPNRRLLHDRLSQAVATAKRNALYGAILMLDLDNFKTINDTRGHDIGDLLLSEMAQRLRSNVREGDTVARLGGDEFVVILEALGADAHDAAIEAKQIGEKLNEAIAEAFDLQGSEAHRTVSIGIALFCSQESGDELLKHADLALYQAKDAGRNTVRFYDPAMQTAVDERSALEAELRDALKRQQFELYYQAQVDSTARIIGAEALVRWQHPQRGLVSPASFIPLAEESGLILPLGRWVLESACDQLAAWAGRPEMAQLSVAVNVSARQFHQPDFVAQVLAALARSGANPQRLKLELTESLLIANVEDIVVKMALLKTHGVGFSLDDFGTGYSSLSYLKRLPLDQLKIDQSFVRDVLSDPNDAAIARTIVMLGKNLGLAVIAEGVETAAQQDFLADNGCLAYQGYLFSRPLPRDGFEALVKRG